MARVVKTAVERKLDIINAAEELFRVKGYDNTSVEAIITKIGVAKGTFYYYFKSKQEVLEAIVNYTLAQIIEMAEQVANVPDMDALTKMQLLLSNGQIGDEDTTEVAEHLHLPANRELHELSNIQTILKLSPVIAKIVEQGNEEKIFFVKRPLETVQFLLTGSQFLLDGGLFTFNEQETQERRLAMQDMVEKTLGAKQGSFGFLSAS